MKIVPTIRFKGFTEEWNAQTLKKIALFSKGRGYSKSDLVDNGTPIVLYGRLYTKYETIISDVDTFAIEKRGSVFSNGTEVVVPSSGETAEDISRASAIKVKNVILGGDLNVIYPNKNLDSIFLALSISNGTAQKELSKKAQGKSVVHLHNSDLEDVSINYPEIDEQEAIGRYFQNIDKLIGASEQKVSKLKTIKKACLEKMFPRHGSTTPDLRFKGFIEEWEEIELGDVCIVKTGCPFDSSEFVKDGKFRVITNGNIQDNSAFVDDSIGNKINIQNKSILDEYLLNIDDILVTMDGTVGRTAKVVYCDQVLAQRVGRLIPYNSSEFVYQSLNAGSFYRQMINIAVGGTIKHISLSDISNYITTIPKNIVEQNSIGLFFKELDELITKNEQKIEKLKNIKKACLDKMFV